MPTPTGRPPIGRHRHGRPASRTPHHEWDMPQKARAAHLDFLEPAWLVLYGPYHRRFYAIARTPAVTEPLIEATTPEELRTLIRQAEAPFSAAAPPGHHAATATGHEQHGGRWPRS
ncbi:hypothetical protein ABGB17_07200 [Sphaerisporangium sp. B11E5]|uniref:hypothetical protein n=1 Tax=Sphaerisporangium sp. B11E5 TaxID=3153563 RepID=UPI00325C5F15